MKNIRKNIIISASLLLLSIIFTILVKVVDVQAIGPNNSSVGFATINNAVFNGIGVHMLFYHITDWMGFIPVIMALVYAIFGIVQVIKRKSLLKVDKEYFVLGAFYILVFGLYVFFEFVVINYRPILMNGFLEASYPSSHTLMALCICGSSVIFNKKMFKNNFSKILNIFSLCVMGIIVVGRLISGVHWFTDILGGLIISSALLMIFYTFLQLINNNRK